MLKVEYTHDHYFMLKFSYSSHFLPGGKNCLGMELARIGMDKDHGAFFFFRKLDY